MLSRSLKYYFPTFSIIEEQWVILCYGLRGEENIKNLNLPSMAKKDLLEIELDAMLKYKLYESQIDSFWISLQKEYSGMNKKNIQHFAYILNFIIV